MQPDHRAHPELAHLVLGHEHPARKEPREVGKGDGHGIFAERAKTLGRVHDLRGGAGRIAVEGAHGRPGMSLAELIGEPDALEIREEQEVAKELGRLGDHWSARARGNEPLGIGQVREHGDVHVLGLEQEVDGQGHRLALDERLAGEELIAPPRVGRDEAVESDLAILESVHQLVDEGRALLLGGQPVAHHHDLGAGVIVRGDLLLHQIEEERAQIIVRRDQPPRDQRLALGLDAGGGVAPVHLLLHEPAIVLAGAEEHGRRMARRRHALEGGELLIDGGGQGLEGSGRIGRLGLRLGEESGRAGEDEQDRPQAPHGAMIPRGGHEETERGRRTLPCSRISLAPELRRDRRPELRRLVQDGGQR